MKRLIKRRNQVKAKIYRIQIAWRMKQNGHKHNRLHHAQRFGSIMQVFFASTVEFFLKSAGKDIYIWNVCKTY